MHVMVDNNVECWKNRRGDCRCFQASSNFSFSSTSLQPPLARARARQIVMAFVCAQGTTRHKQNFMVPEAMLLP